MKNRDPVPAYAMADADRDSDLGDDSPVVCGWRVKGTDRCVNLSARSEGETSGDQSCDSSDEGVGVRDAPVTHPLNHQMNHQSSMQASHHQPILNHQMNNHQSHQNRNSPRPHERDIKVRDDFESLKSSLHPHLSSLASLAQGAPLTAPTSVFALAGAGGGGGFPYAPPAFLAPAPPPPAQPAGSASSSSSEGSAAGWSFEEQYKQVRQLYEISDEPSRKEFLDDLFSFMQKRGTPINRLPIMAKSVLDLYELYNLVIARGGLVEVINKKLWQEIIKGLRLPSSITSAAFTLRTQYMKYLYDYECDKKNLSTRSELDAAIEGNKREGRRASGQYDAQAALAMPPLQRGVPASLAQLSQHMQPLSLSLGGSVGGGMPRLPPLPPHAGHLAPHELEYRVREYMKLIQQQQRDFRRNGSESPPGGNPTPGVMSPRDAALSALDVSRLTLWSFYNNNNNSPQPDLEPQRYGIKRRSSIEALNLSESPNSSICGKREACRSPPPPAKRRTPAPRSPPAPPPSNNSSHNNHQSHVNGTNGAAFKITTRGDATTGDQQLVVSIELNGVTYEGVLFPSQNGNPTNTQHRPMVS